MSRWADRITQHDAFAALSELQADLASAKPMVDEHPEHRESFNRLEALTAQIAAKLLPVDPLLTPEEPYARIAHELRRCATEVSNYSASGSDQNLEQANAYIDNALVQLASLSGLTSSAHTSDLTAALATLHQSVSQSYDAFGRRVHQLQEQLDERQVSLDELQTAITSERTRIDNLLAQFQTQFADRQEERSKEFTDATQRFITEHSTAMTAANTELTGLTTRVQTEFQQLVSATKATLEMDRSQASSSLEELLKTGNADIIQLHTSFADRGDELMAQLNERLQHAAKIVGIIANTGMTGQFQQEANREQRRADMLRYASVASLPIAAVVSGLLILSAGSHATLTELFLKAGVGLPVLGLFFYLSNQSEHHRRRERLNRKLELELTAVGPFLEPLEDSARNIFIEKLADRIFGVQEAERPPDTNMLDIVKQTLKTLDTVVNKIPKK